MDHHSARPRQLDPPGARDVFRERFEYGRSRADEPYGPIDHRQLEQIATLLMADLEAQGRTGHAVAWENARAAIVRDLHLQLDREEVWRLEEGLAPALFERTFGDMRDADGWPSLDLDLGDGRVVRFRGAIDRIDMSPSGVLVVDYKSGSTWGYDDLETDPVSAGRHLQLVLYGLAARTNSAAADEAEVRAEFRFVSKPRQIRAPPDRRRHASGCTPGRGGAARGRRHPGGRVPAAAGGVRPRHVPQLSLLRIRSHLLYDARPGVATQEPADCVRATGTAGVTSERPVAP